MRMRCEVAQHAGPPKKRSCWTRNYSQQLRASCAFSAVQSYVKATRAICAQVVVTFVKHIGIQSACGPNSVKTNPTSTSPPEPYAPHVAKANGERWMSGVSELVRVCELKVSGALGDLLWLVTTLLCERKDFKFCICVCRCASHVSSGYEPQFVFPMHASCESYGPSYGPDVVNMALRC